MTDRNSVRTWANRRGFSFVLFCFVLFCLFVPFSVERGRWREKEREREREKGDVDRSSSVQQVRGRPDLIEFGCRVFINKATNDRVSEVSTTTTHTFFLFTTEKKKYKFNEKETKIFLYLSSRGFVFIGIFSVSNNPVKPSKNPSKKTNKTLLKHSSTGNHRSKPIVTLQNPMKTH